MESEKQTFNRYQSLTPDMAPESFKNENTQGYIDPNLEASQDEMNYYQDRASYLKQVTSHSGEYNRSSADTTVLSQEESPFENREKIYIPLKVKKGIGSNILAKLGLRV